VRVTKNGKRTVMTVCASCIKAGKVDAYKQVTAKKPSA